MTSFYMLLCQLGLIVLQKDVAGYLAEINVIAKHSIQAFMHFNMKPQVIFMSCKVYLNASKLCGGLF